MELGLVFAQLLPGWWQIQDHFFMPWYQTQPGKALSSSYTTCNRAQSETDKNANFEGSFVGRSYVSFYLLQAAIFTWD
jgi:hypothetical protein